MTAPSNSPIYTTSPQCPFVAIASGSANANFDGATGTYTSGVYFGSQGALVDYIKAMPVGVANSGFIRLFYNNFTSGTGGGNASAYWDAIPYTSGTNTAQYFFPAGSTLWNVAASGAIKFSCTVNDAWNIYVHFSNY